MAYTVVQAFNDRAQGGKRMDVGKTYPPEGVVVSEKWLKHLVDFRFNGQPILQADAPKKAGRTKKEQVEEVSPAED